MRVNEMQTCIPESESIDFRVFFGIVVKNIWLIFIVTIIVFAFGFVYSKRSVSQYRSEALLQIDNQQSGSSGNGLAQRWSLGGIGGDNSVATQMALIKSPFILEPVIKELSLNIYAVPKSKYFFIPFLSEKQTIKVNKFTVPLNNINEQFKLILDKKNHISLYDEDNKLILQGAPGSLLVNKANTIHLKISFIAGAIGSEFIISKLSNMAVIHELLSRLKITESGESQGFRQSTGILSLELDGENPEIIVSILNSIAKQSLHKDGERKAAEASQTLDFLYHQIPLAKKSLEIAEDSLNKYRAQSGKIDIKLQTQFLLTQLAEVDKKISLLHIKKIDKQRIYTLIHPSMQALTLQKNALEIERTQLESELKKLPASDQVAVNLMRDVGVKKTLYLILLNKIQEVQVIKAGTLSSIHILSLAKLPDAPLPNHNQMLYLGSLFLGFMVSILIILTRKILYPQVDDPQWSERQFNLPNLATIPFSEIQEKNSIVLKGQRAVKELPILAHVYPKNISIEAIRSLRTNLQVTFAHANNNIVSILGIAPGVGKSFISMNLAYLLAVAGKRVVVIDADLRRGTLHKYINQNAQNGLADILSHKITIDEALVTTAVNANLHFIPRGVYPEDPSELLMGACLKETLSTLSSRYDVVLIDTAPVLLVTDAVLIGVHSATNYLVMGSGVHQPHDVELVLKRLSSAGVSLQGTVFNFYKKERLAGGYYGKYSGYGKYGKYNTYYHDDKFSTT